MVSSTSHCYSVRDDRIGQLFVWYHSLETSLRQTNTCLVYSQMARPDPLSLSEYPQKRRAPGGPHSVQAPGGTARGGD
jgi:hypothetical protein